MPSTARHPTRRSFQALAALLAIEIVAAIAVPVAATAVSPTTSTPAVTASHVRSGPASAAAAVPVAPPSTAPGLGGEDVRSPEDPSARAAARDAAHPSSVRAVPARSSAARPKRSAVAPSGHRGRNHVWSAALGLDRAVAWYACSRSRGPDMAVYRWGCAGSGNVYLLAHAGGPFRRLHDLYASGRLRRGMTVTYADGGGHLRTYAVAWWRVVLPTNGDFAWAAQGRPSMTLQTCVGAGDRYRLVVRLYQTR